MLKKIPVLALCATPLLGLIAGSQGPPLEDGSCCEPNSIPSGDSIPPCPPGTFRNPFCAAYCAGIWHSYNTYHSDVCYACHDAALEQEADDFAQCDANYGPGGIHPDPASHEACVIAAEIAYGNAYQACCDAKATGDTTNDARYLDCMAGCCQSWVR